jgi:hypothetical protein
MVENREELVEVVWHHNKVEWARKAKLRHDPLECCQILDHILKDIFV